MQDSTSGQNPNANFFQPGQGGNPIDQPSKPYADGTYGVGKGYNVDQYGVVRNTIPTPPVPTTTDASALGGNPISLNPAPTPSTNGVSANIGTAIPKAEDIINQGAAPTPAEQQQTTLLQKVAALIGGNKTQTTLTNEAETAAGVPGMTSTVNDLNTQLEGLNNQATALQNEANYTIPNTTQNSVEGKGVTTAGLAPITASQLRANQIKQGAIATQSLTVKSAIFGAQGKLTLAKDAADKAATAQYEQQQQQIDAYKAQLDAIAPSLSKQEKAQAAIVQAQLADRQTKIDNAKEDKKSIIAMATAALTNNPNDPAAQYAAQQALAESNKPQPDLQKALSLVGQYQKDPTAVAQAVANLASTRANTVKTNADIAKTSAETKALNSSNQENVAISGSNGSSANVPVSVAPYADISNSGVPYMDASSLQGTAAEKTQLINQGQAAGLKIITNKNTAADLVNIKDANAKLDSISTIMAGIGQPSVLSRDLGGLGLTKLAVLTQSDPQKAAAGALQAVGLDILKAMSGVQGFRGNASVVQQINDHMPTINDTTDVANQKVAYIRQLISDREDGILGKSNSSKTVQSNGQTYTVGQVYNDGKANWTVDSSGKWTKQ